MNSLRFRLTCTLLVAIITIGLLAMVAAYLNARQEVDEMFDFELKAVALSVDPADLQTSTRDLPDDDILLQVWSDDRTLAYSSDRSQNIPEVEASGLSTLDDATGAHRVYLRKAGNSRIQVTQSLASRRELAVSYSLRLLAPLLLMMPLTGAAIWWLTWRSLAPVGELGEALAARTEGALDPIETRKLPDELLPLVTGFNRLLQKLRAAFEVQRSLVADAAHELRTPLAVVQLQAQTLERAGNTPLQAAPLRALLEGVGRATRVVQQLLTLARHDLASPVAPATSVQMTELVRTLLAELLPLAASRQIDISFEARHDIDGDIDREIVVQGDRGALEAMIANLVDNAIKYTPAGGRISVTLSADHREARLQIIDTGPGIPVDQRSLVLDRFYRIPGSAGIGSGLGLSIAAAVTRQHRGQLLLGDGAEGGLCVDVRLPL